MQRHGSLLVCLASLSALLSACTPDVEENGNVAAPVAGSVEDPDCNDDPDPCAGLVGPGSYAGRFCGGDGPFILTEDISCEEALDNCILNSGANPSLSVQCTWNDVVIFTNEVTPDACDDTTPPPGACDGLDGDGFYAGYFCGGDGPFILTEDISCEEALDNCALNSSANPSLSVWCSWNGVVIFTNEVTPDACASVP